MQPGGVDFREGIHPTRVLNYYYYYYFTNTTTT